MQKSNKIFFFFNLGSKWDKCCLSLLFQHSCRSDLNRSYSTIFKKGNIKSFRTHMAYKCHHRKPTFTWSEIFSEKKPCIPALHHCWFLSHPLKMCVAVAGGELCVLVPAPPPQGTSLHSRVLWVRLLGAASIPPSRRPLQHRHRPCAAAAATAHLLCILKREWASERGAVQRGLQPAAAESSAKWKIREQISRHKRPGSALNPWCAERPTGTTAAWLSEWKSASTLLSSERLFTYILTTGIKKHIKTNIYGPMLKTKECDINHLMTPYNKVLLLMLMFLTCFNVHPFHISNDNCYQYDAVNYIIWWVNTYLVL